MANLASTYWNQGRWEEAEVLQAKELALCSKKLGQRHPDTLISMKNLAFIRKGMVATKMLLAYYRLALISGNRYWAQVIRTRRLRCQL